MDRHLPVCCYCCRLRHLNSAYSTGTRYVNLLEMTCTANALNTSQMNDWLCPVNHISFITSIHWRLISMLDRLCISSLLMQISQLVMISSVYVVDLLLAMTFLLPICWKQKESNQHGLPSHSRQRLGLMIFFTGLIHYKNRVAEYEDVTRKFSAALLIQVDYVNLVLLMLFLLGISRWLAYPKAMTS